MLGKISSAAIALAAMMLVAAAPPPPSTGPAPLPPQSASPAAQVVAAPATSTETHALTADDLHTFFDGMVPYALHRADIAGATFAVVKDGKLLFAQGYGYADLKTKAPVIADKTEFRPGSISKLFTWTSVMQLVQEHKLDLDADINTYLDFKVPDKFGKPITLRNIMTHSAGFEETVTDLFMQKASQQYPLRKYLIDHMPTRIFPPGKVVAYSNYATTLAGYIVQRVSGEPFDQYVADHIFKPLGMDHSSFVQLPPPAILDNMAKGDGKPQPYEIVEAAPAGALASTATDMARFMIAQLENGSYNGAQILKPETVKEMHSRNYTLAPHLLNGFDLGFYQENRNGHTIIGHGGDTEVFHSDLHLILDADTGLFMSFNSAGANGASEPVRVALFRAFLDRYFPYTPPEEKTVADPKPDAARVAGYYVASRRKETGLKALFYLGQTEVTAQPDGQITVGILTDLSGAMKKWREVGPLYYREVGGQTHLEFVTDADGSIDHFASDDFIPVELLQRTHGLQQLNQMKLFGLGTLAICLLAIAIWFGGWILRWRFDRPLDMTPLQSRLRLGSRLGAVLYVAILGGWVVLITAISANEGLLLSGKLTFWYGLLYVVGVLGILGGIAMAANAVSRLMGGPGGWLARAGEIVLGLAGLYMIWAVLDFGLANFQFNI
jgi:CubicO group peptidase (beta-lactamase class C family)